MGAGIVTPQGVIRLPPAGLSSVIDLGQVNASGWGSGTASFDFGFMPKGAETGTIYFTFVPTQYGSTGWQNFGSFARLKDNALTNDTLSFAINTWGPVEWPAMNFYHRLDDPRAPCRDYGLPANDCGHTFPVHSRFNPWTADATGTYLGGQIKFTGTNTADEYACREIRGESTKARVCEDWTVLVHSPKLPTQSATAIGSSLMDVVDASNGSQYVSIMQKLKDAGGKLFDPKRGTNPGSFRFAFEGGLPDAETRALALGGELRTNGSFFEQLRIPMTLLRTYPGAVEVCINDQQPRWQVYGGVTSTTTTVSVCPGTRNQQTGTWTVTPVNVPCLPREPSGLTDPCEGGPGPGAKPEIAPYVPYRSNSIFIQ